MFGAADTSRKIECVASRGIREGVARRNAVSAHNRVSAYLCIKSRVTRRVGDPFEGERKRDSKTE